MWQNKGTNNYVDANIRYKHFFNIVSRILNYHFIKLSIVIKYQIVYFSKHYEEGKSICNFV